MQSTNLQRHQSVLAPPMVSLFEEPQRVEPLTEFHKLQCFGQWGVTEPSKHYYFECPKVRHLAKMPTGSEIKLKTLGFKQERPDGPFTGVSLELTNGFRSINYEWDRDVN